MDCEKDTSKEDAVFYLTIEIKVIILLINYILFLKNNTHVCLHNPLNI